jgi:archaellum component FlaC
MTKTYLAEFRGAIKGNARLRQKIDRLEERIAAIKATVAKLITLADFNGFGDHPITVRAAAEIGWVRMTPEQRTQLTEQLKELLGDHHAS